MCITSHLQSILISCSQNLSQLYSPLIRRGYKGCLLLIRHALPVSLSSKDGAHHLQCYKACLSGQGATASLAAGVCLGGRLEGKYAVNTESQGYAKASLGSKVLKACMNNLELHFI